MKRTLIDLADRAGATFAQAFLAAITVDASGIAQVDALKVAAVAGGFAVAKFALIQANAYLARPVPEPPVPTSTP